MRFSLFALLLTIVFPGRAEAGSLLRMAVEELSRNADMIVRGTVADVKSQLTGDRSSFHTTIVISVQDQWKGKPASSLTLIQPGGSVGEMGEEIPGLPSFTPSDKVILFVKEVPEGKLTVLGGDQGKFTLRFDAAVGSEVVESETGERVPLTSFACRVKKTLGAKAC